VKADGAKGAERCMPDDNFYETLVENIPELLKVINQNGTGQYFNRCWLEFTGRTLEQEVGTGWLDGLHHEDIQGYLKVIKEACGKRQNTLVEYRLKRVDGVYRWILEKGKPVFSREGEFESYISSCMDITEQKQVLENNGNTYFDEITGLPNRRFFDDYLRREWGRAARSVRSLTLLMCSAGYSTPEDNHYVKLLGSAIKSELSRSSDFLALYNNKKFAAILPETDAQGAAVVVNRIRTRVQALVSEYNKSQKKKKRVPAIGITCVVPTIDVPTAAELVELAEKSCCRQKHESNNGK
jgi:PAS domain S-box-containing protein/diguanylate cyclase (GGDEF)-like protein